MATAANNFDGRVHSSQYVDGIDRGGQQSISATQW